MPNDRKTTRDLRRGDGVPKTSRPGKWEHPRASTGRSMGMPVVRLGLLLIIPSAALFMALKPPILWYAAGYAVLLSWITGLVYRSDKRKARAAEWRISEPTLHFLDLLGGWPGGYLAQHYYRHKTAKVSFQAVFWVIVALHQLVAVDSLLGWRMSHCALPLLHSGWDLLSKGASR